MKEIRILVPKETRKELENEIKRLRDEEGKVSSMSTLLRELLTTYLKGVKEGDKALDDRYKFSEETLKKLNKKKKEMEETLGMEIPVSAVVREIAVNALNGEKVTQPARAKKKRKTKKKETVKETEDERRLRIYYERLHAFGYGDGQEHFLELFKEDYGGEGTTEEYYEYLETLMSIPELESAGISLVDGKRDIIEEEIPPEKSGI